MYKITDLYDLNHTQASSYLQKYEYPWEALKGIKDFIIELGSEYSANRRPLVTVEKSTKYAEQVHFIKILNTLRSPL